MEMIKRSKQVIVAMVALALPLAVMAFVAAASIPFEGNLSCADLGYAHEGKIEAGDLTLGIVNLGNGLIIEITEILYEKPDDPEDITSISWVIGDSSSAIVSAVIWKASAGGHYIIGEELTRGTMEYNEHGSKAGLSHLSFCHEGPTAIDGLLGTATAAGWKGGIAGIAAGVFVLILLLISFKMMGRKQ